MKILLAITGSIAAVKAYDAIRLFQDNGYDVQCVVSKGGEKFISRLALESLSQYPVLGPDIFSFALSHNKYLTEETYNRKNNTEIFAHIEITKDIDAVVILPASANFIANYAHGNASDFLSAMMLANTKPVLICPAMNSKMWKDKAVQENIKNIKTRENILIVPPKQSGTLACGDEGVGKLASLEVIALYLEKLLCKQHALQNKTVLINMGGTQEKIDPVRVISNISSGNTGKIIAEQCFILGAKKVICVLGNVQISFEYLKEIENFSLNFLTHNSAHEMLQQTEKFTKDSDIIIFSAAVSDYTPKEYSKEKIKKNFDITETLSIKLSKTCDIAKHITEKYKNISNNNSHKIYIGFALETEKNEKEFKMLIKNKCIAKNLDYILGNRPENFSLSKNSENYEYIIFEQKSNSFMNTSENKNKKYIFFRNFLASLNK